MNYKLLWVGYVGGIAHLFSSEEKANRALAKHAITDLNISSKFIQQFPDALAAFNQGKYENVLLYWEEFIQKEYVHDDFMFSESEMWVSPLTKDLDEPITLHTGRY